MEKTTVKLLESGRAVGELNEREPSGQSVSF